ncbi:hypothetical protein AMATHDRAFT_193949 [Amanita thiersii Skay4041]|uniref:choline-phosphate cytidylyltransferase n=1 Tax=Amanita thiersii Skay4041 TaxID=703135 RepID=A0A2A9NQI7_9AGAR|nr:hypothetical protein AMATHDRAFT_193949 [Amanita thiersii Skay4041]
MSIEQGRKTLHSKRSFGKWPRTFDSPAYDASEEDNDPLTDDGASAVSIPVVRHSSTTQPASRILSRPPASSSSSAAVSSIPRSTARHHLASALLSDSDGVDSPTYDGDIESSTTMGVDGTSTSRGGTHLHLHHRTSSVSTLSTPGTPVHPSSSFQPPHNNQITPSSEPVDPLIPPQRAVDPQSQQPVFITAPDPTSPTTKAKSPDPASFTEDDIQDFVRKAIEGDTTRTYKINPPPKGRPIRIYADGVYDLFHFGHALQLRQAKLSFPSVHLLVGVCSDDLVKLHKSRSVMTHAERVEAAKHCRWVDEVLSDAPWIIDDAFVQKHQIDYVAHDEMPYAGAGQDDVYGPLKAQGKFLPTRRTPGISTSDLLERIVAGYRNRDFDEKLTKMGKLELRAEGSDFDDRSNTGSSRNASQHASRAESPAQQQQHQG